MTDDKKNVILFAKVRIRERQKAFRGRTRPMRRERKRMKSRIYVREYGGSPDDPVLRERAGDLPLQLPDGWTEGIRWKKSRQRILAWLLLGQAIEERFGYSFAQLDIRRGGEGKPYSAAHPEIYFNISHCDTAYACIVGTAPVGIDVERKFSPKDGLVRKVCHPEEFARLERMGQEARTGQFRYLWSLKEAFVKMDGRGLGYGMDRVNFAPFLPVQTELGKPVRRNLGEAEFVICDHENYTLAACEMQDGAGRE